MDRTTPAWLRSVLTLTLIAVIAGVSPLALAQAENVALSGRIFQADGATPYANVTVRVMDQTTGETVATTTTNTGGEYWFEELDPGTYTFEVEVSDGIYQLDRAVQIGMDERASISFTVKPTAGAGAASGAAAPAEPGMSKKKKGWLIGGIAFGAVLIGLALSNDDSSNEASPFTP